MIDGMTLDEMKTYKGRQEPPEDFDNFWQKEIIALPKEINYTFHQKDFRLASATFYELAFEANDGSEISAKCIFPNVEKAVPVVFQFHGYQGQSPDWSEGLKYTANECAFIAMDVRGQAGKSIDNGAYRGNTAKGHIIRGLDQGLTNLFFKQVYLDVYQLIQIISSLDNIDSNEMYATGASQGGSLAIVGAALTQKIKKVAIAYPFLSDFNRVLEVGNHSEAYDELFRYFKFQDPWHEKEQQVMDTLAYIDIKNFAEKVQAKSQMVITLEDAVCFPSTQFAVYNRLSSESKKLIVLPEYGHDAMNAKIPDQMYNFLLDSNF